jgi:hypothetical protein
MGNQLKAGEAFPALRARTIHDRELAIPDPGRWVPLQEKIVTRRRQDVTRDHDLLSPNFVLHGKQAVEQ